VQHQTQCLIFNNQQLKVSNIFQKFCNNCSVSKTKFPQCLDLSFIFVRYFTHNQSYRPNCDYELKYWRIYRVYYNAMLHVNIKIMTSQQRWYLLLSYFNDKINFLFSCEMRSSSLRFREFDICQVNTAQSNTLVHSIVPNKWPKFGAKILGHFWDITIFVLRYYILHHPVYNVTNSSVIVETASVTACVKARL